MANAHGRMTRRTALVLPLMASAGLITQPAWADDVHGDTLGADVVARWYDVTGQMIAAAGSTTTPIINARTWAVAWLAAAKALARDSRTAAVQQAAVATAVHDALAALLPTQVGVLDGELAATLDAIPDVAARLRGVEAGRAAAATVVRERAGDGLDDASINISWPTPAPAPGVWQPTPPAFSPAAQAGQGKARPFLLRSGAQFRPGPPPAPDSPTALRDLDEVRAVGSAAGTVRTDAQTTTARIWAQPALTAYGQALRAVAVDRRSPLRRRACLLAAFHVAIVDAQIAYAEAKYTYVHWRPVTAVRAAGDTEWLPLATTPSHPEYPSGSVTFTSTAETLLTALVGRRIPTPVTVTSAAFPGLESRVYTEWRQITQDSMDGRVWAGAHFRNTTAVSATFGRKLAMYHVANLHRLYGFPL